MNELQKIVENSNKDLQSEGLFRKKPIDPLSAVNMDYRSKDPEVRPANSVNIVNQDHIDFLKMIIDDIQVGNLTNIKKDLQQLIRSKGFGGGRVLNKSNVIKYIKQLIKQLRDTDPEYKEILDNRFKAYMLIGTIEDAVDKLPDVGNISSEYDVRTLGNVRDDAIKSIYPKGEF
jgi:hypothetical protein